MERARTLFEETFASGDDGFLVAYWWPDDDSRTYEDELLALLPAESRDRIERTEDVSFWNEPGDDYPFVRLIAPVRPRALDYGHLFRLIAHAELGFEPAIVGWIYIVNRTDPLIFRMYDDRGAILHAPSGGRVRHLYEKHADWLVEARPKVESLFGRPPEG